MRLYPVYLVSFVFLFSFHSSGQSVSKKWHKIDSLAWNVPIHLNKNLDSIARYAQKFNFSDTEKARFVYAWIANNIQYDIESFIYLEYGKNSQRIQKVIQTQKAVCQGYSNLFEALGNKLNLQTWTVLGYGRTDPEGPMNYHAWNAVKIDGAWQLLDVTWGSGYILNRKYVKHLTSEFFLVQPDIFIRKHLPLDPAWQLLDYPFSKGNFKTQTFVPLKIKEYMYTDTLTHFFALDSMERDHDFYRRAVSFDPQNEFCRHNLAATKINIANNASQLAVDSMNAYVETLNKGFKSMPYLNKSENKLKGLVHSAAENFQKSIDIYTSALGLDASNDVIIQQNLKNAQHSQERVAKEKRFIEVLFATKKPLRPLTLAKYNEMVW